MDRRVVVASVGVQGGGAPLVENQVLGGLGGAGVLDQAERVHQAVSRRPAAERGRWRSSCRGRRCRWTGWCRWSKAIAAAGAEEEVLVAGHGARQGQLGDEVVVRLGEGETRGSGRRRRLRRSARDSVSPARAVSAPFDGRELHRIGGLGLGGEHPLKGVDKVLGGDGVVGGLAAGGLVGRGRTSGGRCRSVRRRRPSSPRTARSGARPSAVQPDQSAVQVGAGDDVLRGSGNLGVEVGGNLLHKPGKAVDARALGAACQRQQQCRRRERRQKTESRYVSRRYILSIYSQVPGTETLW